MEYRLVDAAKGAVVADALPEGEAAVAELEAVLIAHLLERFPERFERVEGGLRRASLLTLRKEELLPDGAIPREALIEAGRRRFQRGPGQHGGEKA